MSRIRAIAVGKVFPSRKDGDGNKLCCYCGKKLQGKKTRYCSQECIDEVLIRCHPNYARREVFNRDKGVCVVCGKDTQELDRRLKRINARLYSEPCTYERSREIHRRIRKFTGLRVYQDFGDCWQADHIKPVIQGGGLCGLENLRTLCRDCHKRVTAELAAKRAKRRIK